jgi:hypothetical protein
LVRYDKRKVPGVVDGFYGLLGSFHPSDLVRIKSVAIILIEDPITIKENCRTPQSLMTHVGGKCPQYSDNHCFNSTCCGWIGLDFHAAPSAASSLLLAYDLASFCHF